ncbi:MAG: glycosyltransferase N-terminal domain-containing protein [Spirochaetota bacterium]|nr:glycosyltransferase N-terminal domain-containing protein [Spirochaetota bacterium]
MIYEIFIFVASLLGRIASVYNRKARKFFSLRKGEIDRIEEYFRNNPGNRVIWFHSASAGEFEQAKPIIEYLKKDREEIRIVASFFSPSGFEAGIKYREIDLCFNLPLDYRRNIKRLLNCIKPEIIIYSKYDIWHNLSTLANRRDIKLIMISATIPESSLRHRFPFRIFFSRTYGLFCRIYAISKEDALRFIRIIGRGKKGIVIISGDTRFDRVKTVLKKKPIAMTDMILRDKEHQYIIAGSTYEVSENKLLNVAMRLRDGGEKAIFILVPHEVDSENIDRIKENIKSRGFMPIIYSKSKDPILLKEEEMLIVDVQGVLAYLYEIADIVFIGGSFKGSVHSVLEPAIFGKPILTGPFIKNAFEAISLKDIGGLSVCRNEDELYKMIKTLMDDKLRNNMSKRVKEYFNENLGACRYIIHDMKKFI